MNTFGRIFRVSIFGESHGSEIGVTLDGVEPGIALSEQDFAIDIARRGSGAKGTTPRREPDRPRIISGVCEGLTTGAPLTILFANTSTHSEDYLLFRDIPRPGHADFAANIKYAGYNDLRGGGHFSGRLTLPIVAAGVVAKKILRETVALETDGHVRFVDSARLVELGGSADESRWPALLDEAAAEGDSLGGVVECVVDGLPAGLGEPFWDSVESCLAHAIFAIPGVRGIEFGDGFAAAAMRGSEHNDPFDSPAEPCHCHAHGEEPCHDHEEGECHCHTEGHHGLVHPRKNGAGGINGGITNGNPLVFRVAFKPTSSIRKAQQTWNFSEERLEPLVIPGRHDVCFALRTPVVVEAMAALVLADLIDIA